MYTKITVYISQAFLFNYNVGIDTLVKSTNHAMIIVLCVAKCYSFKPRTLK